MQQIPISVNPVQTLSITLDNNFYDINLYANADNPDGSSGISSVDIIRNGTAIITGIRALSNFPLIPAVYLEDGNFMIVTQNDQYPDWRQFGITQFLIYASAAELGVIRGTGT